MKIWKSSPILRADRNTTWCLRLQGVHFLDWIWPQRVFKVVHDILARSAVVINLDLPSCLGRIFYVTFLEWSLLLGTIQILIVLNSECMNPRCQIPSVKRIPIIHRSFIHWKKLILLLFPLLLDFGCEIVLWEHCLLLLLLFECQFLERLTVLLDLLLFGHDLFIFLRHDLVKGFDFFDYVVDTKM